MNIFTLYVDSVGILCKNSSNTALIDVSSDGIICKNPYNFVLILLGKRKNLVQISFEVGCNYT